MLLHLPVVTFLSPHLCVRFVTAIREAGLESELRRAGAFTLFLPTNEAFEV